MPATPPPGKKKIIHLIVKHIKDRAPREIFNDDIAKALDLDPRAVRNSIRNWIRDHADAGIEETSPYYYTGVDPSIRPVSAQPALERDRAAVRQLNNLVDTMKRPDPQGDIIPTYAELTGLGETWTLFKRLPSGDVLLHDDAVTPSLWVGTKL
jgi:hypothetical protein